MFGRGQHGAQGLPKRDTIWKVKTHFLENEISADRRAPLDPLKTMLRCSGENVFARRETIWRVPTGDVLLAANIALGGQGGERPTATPTKANSRKTGIQFYSPNCFPLR